MRNLLNLIEAVAEKDGRIFKDFVEINFNMQPYLLKNGKLPFKEICINLGSRERTFIDELTKQVWFPDQPYREGSWGYIGGETYALESNERQSYGTDQNI